MVMIRAEKNELEDDDFNVEIKVSEEAINLIKNMFDDNSIGEIELIDTILSILTEMYNTNHKNVITLKHSETFQLSASNEHTFDVVVSLIKDTFKGEILVKNNK